MRNSTHGKGHEEGGFSITQRQDRASGDPLFPSIYPQNQSLLVYCFMLSPTPLTLRGPPPPLSEKELTYSSS